MSRHVSVAEYPAICRIGCPSVQSVEQQVSAAEQQLQAAQQRLCQARQELERRISDYDTCVAECKPQQLLEATLQHVHDQEEAVKHASHERQVWDAHCA
jgi:TolA-binding protein